MGRPKEITYRIQDLYQEYMKVEGYLKNERRPGPIAAFRKQKNQLYQKIQYEIIRIKKCFSGSIIRVKYLHKEQEKEIMLVNISAEDAEYLVNLYAQVITGQEIVIKSIEEITLSAPEKL